MSVLYRPRPPPTFQQVVLDVRGNALPEVFRYGLGEPEGSMLSILFLPNSVVAMELLSGTRQALSKTRQSGMHIVGFWGREHGS